jgi:hypothetical protein
MTGLRSIYRHWQVEHYEARRRHEEQSLFESRVRLGAFGVRTYEEAPPSNLNDSLLVAWLAAGDRPDDVVLPQRSGRGAARAHGR